MFSNNECDILLLGSNDRDEYWGVTHLLPTFHGFQNEDPHKHIKEFHVICSTMRPQGVTEEQTKLRAVLFSLADKARDWLYYLLF